MEELTMLSSRLIFNMLLVTDGRTTDLLESLLGESMHVTVISQEQWKGEQSLGEKGSPYYVRESALSGMDSGFVVSHNIALVHATNVPPALFERIAHKQEGIGKAISAIGVESFRKVIETGYVPAADAVDLFGHPISLRFPPSQELVPYKKYVIYFGLVPGIQLLEYYNPELVTFRLTKPDQAE
ncbi:4-hydroxybenzoate synthetase [Paenibacillus sp. PL2-23]|uniref:4-hydroxybenzoate synthetase n=1 Tax=Paenibacillus sp. PL2-23 TaxID=2100729 RepID=UPI0030F5CEE3